MDWNVFFSFLGSAMGCIGGILASQKLTNFRLQQLEEKVNKHNNLVERMTINEMKVKNIEEKIRYKEAESWKQSKNRLDA